MYFYNLCPRYQHTELPMSLQAQVDNEDNENTIGGRGIGKRKEIIMPIKPYYNKE